MEQKRLEEAGQKRGQRRRTTSSSWSSGQLRLEIWIRPDGSSSRDQMTPEEEEEEELAALQPGDVRLYSFFIFPIRLNKEIVCFCYLDPLGFEPLTS